jgi:hypothetical protein
LKQNMEMDSASDTVRSVEVFIVMKASINEEQDRVDEEPKDQRCSVIL